MGEEVEVRVRCFLDGHEAFADNNKSRLNGNVPQDHFRQVRQIENSGELHGVEHAVRLVHVVTAGQLMSGVVRIHDVRRDAPSVGH